MNTLCHLVLGYPDPDLMLGQFLGDHVKGPVEDSPYSSAVQQGIRDHRRVDAMSDRHEITQFAKSLLPRHYRRYGGIVLDLYGDALLAMIWDHVMEASFGGVLHEIEGRLKNLPEILPASATQYAERVISYRLLQAYTDVTELPQILDRVGASLRRPARLSPVLEYLQQAEEDFILLFPDYFIEMRNLTATKPAGCRRSKNTHADEF